MLKAFQKFLPNIFISIVPQGEVWKVYSKVIKNGILTKKLSENFDKKESDKIPIKMQEYLDDLQLEYNFAYIALFLDSMGQGAISGTTAADFEKNSVDIKSVTHFSLDNKWSIYASYIDINWVKKLFSSSGLDFIYSPFMIQYTLIKKEKQKEKPTLYILNHEDSVTVTVFSKDDLLFGVYFKTTTDSSISSSDEDDWENASEEEGVDNISFTGDMSDDMDSMGELDNLDDFDNLEDNSSSESFQDSSLADQNIENFDDEDLVQDSDLELFGRDLLVYKYLKASLKEYYQNPLYKSSFIDTVVIYDGYETSSEFIGMIEDDLFMDIEISKIDINETICNMARKEVFS